MVGRKGDIFQNELEVTSSHFFVLRVSPSGDPNNWGGNSLRPFRAPLFAKNVAELSLLTIAWGENKKLWCKRCKRLKTSSELFSDTWAVKWLQRGGLGTDFFAAVEGGEVPFAKWNRCHHTYVLKIVRIVFLVAGWSKSKLMKGARIGSRKRKMSEVQNWAISTLPSYPHIRARGSNFDSVSTHHALQVRQSSRKKGWWLFDYCSKRRRTFDALLYIHIDKFLSKTKMSCALILVPKSRCARDGEAWKVVVLGGESLPIGYSPSSLQRPWRRRRLHVECCDLWGEWHDSRGDYRAVKVVFLRSC